MRLLRVAAVVLAAGLFAQAALAASGADGLQLGQIVDQQSRIRTDVIAGNGRYRDMPQATKDELLARQDKLLKMIGDKRDPGELTKAERLEAFNTLEWIEAAINKEPDERMVCTRERQTGSMRITTVCKTQRQINEARARAQEQMLGTKPMDI
jgi:hypothetical protein